jgi:CRISPR-associated protein Csx17
MTKPLSSYLKAIAILRILSEQKDPEAKGCWAGEHFLLHTHLDRDALINFFCTEYSPTPIVAPWNGGSGFYLGDSHEGIDAILKNSDKRFDRYRQVIHQVRTWPEMPAFDTVEDVRNTLLAALKPLRSGRQKEKLESLLQEIEEKSGPLKKYLGRFGFGITLAAVEGEAQKGGEHQAEWRDWWHIIKRARTYANNFRRSLDKEKILPICRNNLPESVIHWIDAICTLQSLGNAKYNPVLGTGGNEGRLELSNNFMQRVTELFINASLEKNKNLFLSSVFETTTPGLMEGKIGQFDPGRAGGYNQGMEVETKDFKINPWDFILTIEGALVISGSLSRRIPTEERAYFTIPFTVRFSSVGFSSAAYGETGRYETWFPVWTSPARFPEIKYLFGEGRAVLGRRIAKTGLEFSRAVGRLGVDRGIDSFERYAFLKRRGESYVALPAGRIPVRFSPILDLLDELDRPIGQVRNFLKRFKNIPATYLSAQKNVDEAIFACTKKPTPSSFSNLMRAIGNLEELIARRDRAKDPKFSKPLSGLSPRWVEACDDRSVEVRIAAALASVRGSGKVGPLRSNMAGVDPSQPWLWADGKGQKNWYGNTLADRLSGVLKQRLMDAVRTLSPSIPTAAALPISPHDVAPFVWGQCDDTKIEELLWGFLLIDWTKYELRSIRERWRTPLSEHPLPRSWCLLKLLHQPEKIRSKAIKIEPRIIPLLMAGRMEDACEAALHRLRVSGLSPFQVVYEDNIDPARLTASLLIPVKDQWQLESLVLEPFKNGGGGKHV